MLNSGLEQDVRRLPQQIQDAASYIRDQWSGSPRVGMILGTGLGDLTNQIQVAAKLPYAEIPHFPESTVEEHAGQLVCGTICGTEVVAMEGRFHYYEGYSLQQVTFPVRVMRELGAEILLVTNAAGGMNPQFDLADIVIIEDHINLLPDNPLRGVNVDSLGPRFPDMSQPYDKSLLQLADTTARDLNIPAHKGVFVAVAGPNLETRAEYRMLRGFGADVVGMSTVPEVIVAQHCGLRALGFSVITDLCLPDALEPANIQEIVRVAGHGGERLAQLIPAIIKQLD